MSNLSKKRTNKQKKPRNSQESDPSESMEVGKNQEGQTEYVRVRLPKNGELLGVVTQILGADRIQVRSTDGKSRIVRIPGKYRKRMWCRVNDVVTILPWYGLQEDTRADLVHRYNRNQADWLEKKGYIKLD